jgi:hypothetical protein
MLAFAAGAVAAKGPPGGGNDDATLINATKPTAVL